MHLRKIGGNRIDANFWQILVVCSAADITLYARGFIGALELYSPDTRLVFFVHDIDKEREDHLEQICRSVYGLSVYVAESDPVPKLSAARLVAAKKLLDVSKIHTLVLDVKAIVRGDLTLLPVLMQRADVATDTHFGKKRKARRVYSDLLWLAPNLKTSSFLAEAIHFLEHMVTSGMPAENRAVYAGLVRSRRFISLVRLPRHYVGRSLDEAASIWSLPSDPSDATVRSLDAERSRIEELFNVVPRRFVLMPKQDVGTKTNLDNNTFKRRTERLGRPGRMYWRFMAQFIALSNSTPDVGSRVVPVPQWEVRRVFRDLEPSADRIFVPHLLRKQFDSAKAVFYMQELLPSLFTVDPNGWGPAAGWYGDESYRAEEVDTRVDGFVSQVRKDRITKAPQTVGSSMAPAFDILAPLQVPGDDALTFHSDVGIDEFVSQISSFANTNRIRVLFRPHPHDHTRNSERLAERYTSDYVSFSDAEHIHDLISRAAAVAVINSGVGFEAMLYDRPVLCFGRAVYDTAVHVVRNGDVAAAYRNAVQESDGERWDRYRRFISWYVYRIGYKLDEASINLTMAAPRQFDLGPNPLYSNIVHDISVDRKGTKCLAIPNEDKLRQFGATFRHKRARLKKTSVSVLNKFNKQYVLEIDSLARSHLMKVFDPSMLSGKRVALIGNASSALNFAAGADIDAHDVVIRMNLGYPFILRRTIDPSTVPDSFIRGTFFDTKSSGNEKLTILRSDLDEADLRRLTHTEALGKKTTIWSCSTADKKRQLFFAPLFACTTVACHPHYQNLSLRFIIGNKLFRLPDSNYTSLRNELGIEPTSGLLWINYLLNTSLSELSVYGFDFFASGHVMRHLPNTLEVTGRWRHDPTAEKQYVLRVLSESDSRLSVYPRPSDN